MNVSTVAIVLNFALAGPINSQLFRIEQKVFEQEINEQQSAKRDQNVSAVHGHEPPIHENMILAEDHELDGGPLIFVVEHEKPLDVNTRLTSGQSNYSADNRIRLKGNLD